MRDRTRHGFTIGDRVEHTDKYPDTFKKALIKTKTGTVVGFSRCIDKGIRVLRDGAQTPETYSINFWRKIESEGRREVVEEDVGACRL